MSRHEFTEEERKNGLEASRKKAAETQKVNRERFYGFFERFLVDGGERSDRIETKVRDYLTHANPSKEEMIRRGDYLFGIIVSELEKLEK